MGKGLFFNLPGARGHVNPTLSLVAELVARGETIIYYADRTVKEEIEATGAIFRDFNAIHPFVYDKQLAKDMLALALKELEVTEEAIDRLIALAKEEKPDYIIYDSFCPWGKYLALYMHIPAIASMTTVVSMAKVLFSDWRFFVEVMPYFLKIKTIVGALQKAKRILIRYGLYFKGYLYYVFDIFRNEGRLNLVFTLPQLQPFREDLDEKRFLFLGCKPFLLRQKNHQWRFPAEGPFIYIALGTLHNEQLNFYRQCIEALSDSPNPVILVIGKAIQAKDLGPIPNHVYIFDFVPQLEVLTRTKVFITHGGANSIQEGLYFGVPLLLFPQTPEQYLNAKMVQKTGAGVLLSKKKPTAADIRQQIDLLLHDASFTRNAQDISQKMRDNTAFTEAVERILALRQDHEKI